MENKLEKITLLNPGEKFMFKGFEWITLDKDEEGIFAMMTSFWRGMPFDKDDYNNWAKSSSRKILNSEFLELIGKENLIQVESDLIADNGDRSYGKTLDYIAILSHDQFRKYRDVVIDVVRNFDDYMFTLTPWDCKVDGSPNYAYGYTVRIVYPTGPVSTSNALTSSGVAPACKFSTARLNLCRQAQLVEPSK